MADFVLDPERQCRTYQFELGSDEVSLFVVHLFWIWVWVAKSLQHKALKLKANTQLFLRLTNRRTYLEGQMRNGAPVVRRRPARIREETEQLWRCVSPSSLQQPFQAQSVDIIGERALVCRSFTRTVGEDISGKARRRCDR